MCSSCVPKIAQLDEALRIRDNRKSDSDFSFFLDNLQSGQWHFLPGSGWPSCLYEGNLKVAAKRTSRGEEMVND